MTGTDDTISRTGAGSVQRLRNHWTRPLGPLVYYWFLTFEESSELHALVEKCQELIDFPFYDRTPPESLSLTIDRIAAVGGVSADHIESVTSSAIRACRAVTPFELEIERLSGVPSAVALARVIGGSPLPAGVPVWPATTTSIRRGRSYSTGSRRPRSGTESCSQSA